MKTYDAEGTTVYYGKEGEKAPGFEMEDLILIPHIKFKYGENLMCPFFLVKHDKCLYTEVRNILDSAPPVMQAAKVQAELMIKTLWPEDMVKHVLNLCGDGGSCDKMPRYEK